MFSNPKETNPVPASINNNWQSINIKYVASSKIDLTESVKYSFVMSVVNECILWLEELKDFEYIVPDAVWYISSLSNFTLMLTFWIKELGLKENDELRNIRIRDMYNIISCKLDTVKEQEDFIKNFKPKKRTTKKK